MMKRSLRTLLLPRIATQINEDTYPKIPLVPEGESRPFWSVMIPTYNRPELLAETLKSVLAQDIGPEDMQVAVIDNHSTVGDIAQVVHDVGQGRIEYYCQPQHVGVAENFNTCLAKSRGYWVHMLTDDDLALPGAYDAYRRNIEQTGCKVIYAQAAFVHGNSGKIEGQTRPIREKDGVAVNPYELIWQNDSFAVVTMVVSRALLEQVGGYNSQMYFAMDLELSARLFKKTCVGFIAEPIIGFRIHDKQESRVYWRKRESIRDVGRACCWLQLYIEPQNWPRIYDYASQVTHELSVALTHQGHKPAAVRHALMSFRLTPSQKTALHLLQVLSSGRPRKLYRKIRGWGGKAKRRLLHFLGGRPPAQQSELERLRQRLANVPRFQRGRVQAYGWDLEYVDGPSMFSSLDILINKGWNDFKFPHDHPVILDCGANVGLSVLRYKQLYPKAKITAFEPDREISQVLRRNLARNEVNDVEIVEAAVWTKTGKMDFYAEGADGSRLLSASDKLDNSYQVETCRLADYINDQVDFIKLDIEGAEAEVLADCEDVLPKVQQMVIEFHHTLSEPDRLVNTLAILSRAGFKTYVDTLNWKDLRHTEQVVEAGSIGFDQYLLICAWQSL